MYYSAWFITTLIYIGFDYFRPMDYTPIGLIKPMMILTLILLFFLLINKKIFYFPAKQLKYLAYFIALYIILIFFAFNRHYAFNTAFDLFFLMIVVLSIVNTITDIPKLKVFFYLINLTLIFVSIYALFHGGRGTGNFLTDENDLSLFINTWLPFSLFLFKEEKKKIWKYLFLAGIFFGILGVIVSFSRGGFLGLVGIFFVMWIYSRNRLKSLLVVFLLSLIMIMFADQKYWDEMATVTDTEDSTADERLLSWEAAWNMFLDKPWGGGGNNFQFLFPQYQPDELKKNMWGRVAHSIWFTLLPESGLIGTIIFFYIILYNIKDIFQLKKETFDYKDEQTEYLFYLSQAFLAGHVGFFISATFISVLYYPHFYYLSAILIATMNVSVNSVNKYNTSV